MPSSLRTFRLGSGDEATLVSTSSFSEALIRWYRRRRVASDGRFFEAVDLKGQIGHQLL